MSSQIQQEINISVTDYEISKTYTDNRPKTCQTLIKSPYFIHGLQSVKMLIIFWGSAATEQFVSEKSQKFIFLKNHK